MGRTRRCEEARQLQTVNQSQPPCLGDHLARGFLHLQGYGSRFSPCSGC
jgi:hypothetical protein